MEGVDFAGSSVVKNPPATAGDLGSIPGWGRSLEKEMATHSSIHAWRIPGTEEPSGPRGCKEWDTTELLNYQDIYVYTELSLPWWPTA